MQELSQLYYLKREIEMDKQRLLELENKALPGAQALSGLPGSPNVQDKLAAYATKIADLRTVIQAKHNQCLAEQQRLEKYIADIEDSFIRQLFTYRFVEGLTWQQVANKLGGKNSAANLYKMAYRFVRRK